MTRRLTCVDSLTDRLLCAVLVSHIPVNISLHVHVRLSTALQRCSYHLSFLLVGAGSAIYALDIHHSGERMATCGIDYKIRIWAMRPILSHSAENDPNQPKLLAALADHAGCVNVVRFAPVSNLLASGSDDKALCIYELKPGEAACS